MNLKPATVAKLKNLGPAAASAILLLLAFPPYNVAPLVLVAFVPWLVALRTATGKEAWRSGYCFGFVYGLGQLLWIGQLTYHWVGSIWPAAVAWLLACAVFALYFGWSGVLMRHAWARGWPWAVPLVWAGIEVFRSFIRTFAFPYGLVATPLWPYPALIQLAHFGSIYLMTAWVLLVNVVLAMLLAREPYSRVRVYVSTVFAGLLISGIAYRQVTPSAPMTMTLGQPGVDMAFGTPEAQRAGLQANVARIVREADGDGSQLLILPEGITDVPVMPPQPVFPLPRHIPVIFGGERGVDPIFQSAFAFDGTRWQIVDKTRLVVFGEFVPGRDLFSWLIRDYRLPSADLTPGRRGVQSVVLGGRRIGPVVCFEALFPDVSYLQARQGARLLAVIGIDDWFMDGAAPEQLRAASVWRAVETGLPLVRATTLGYTLACDDRGRIIAEAPLRIPIGLRVTVSVPNASTLFSAFPVFPACSCLFALAFPWLPNRASRRKNNAEQEKSPSAS